MKLKMLDDRVLVEIDEAEKITKGGILLPDSVKERPSRGKVIAAGPGEFVPELCAKAVDFHTGQDQYPIIGRRPLSVQVGDTVLFGRYSGNPLPDNERMHILREADILAVVEEE
jgi:chaperonin GroES